MSEPIQDTNRFPLTTESRLGLGPYPKTFPEGVGAQITDKVHVWITSDT